MRAVLVTLFSGVLLGSAMAQPVPVITTPPAGAISAFNFRQTDVEDIDGLKIGKIEDVVFTRDGVVLAYVIEVGGFLGMGAKLVALPPTAFEFLTEKDMLKVPYTKAQLTAAQEYTLPKRKRTL